jgi:LuxR family maltose regulon positive regulatory protein
VATRTPVRYPTPTRPVPARLGIPPPPQASIRRERLEGELDRQSDQPLTVVTGPAGSGKTVLLAAWASPRTAAWLSVGPEHLDVTRLWRDIAAALGPVGIHLPGEPRSGGAHLADVTLELRDALERAPRRATLVLDDVHLLRGPALALVAALVSEGGGGLRVAIASRSDPDLHLGRLRLEGRLGELRAMDLAFTCPEAGALLAEHGLSLRPDQVERLVSRTEGWAAGLRLAALSLQAEPDPDRFVADFTGDDHAVADYLSGEVLALQRPAVREFLLRTSVADRVCGGLADALSGGRDGARALVEVHRAGLFLMPVDRRETWFRYHPLFAELLRARLRLERPQLWTELHGRAARWLAGQDLGREALPHALEAGEQPGMVDVLADQWLDLLISGQAADAVLAAARLQPRDRRLAVAAAGACLGAGDVSGAEAVLAATAGEEDDDVAALAALMRARARADVGGARVAAGRLLAASGGAWRLAVPADDARRSLALLHLGVTEFAAGRADAAADALDGAAALAVDARRERVLLECLGRTAALEVLAGRLTRAETAATAARALAEPTGWERTAACAWAYAALAAVHWLRNDLADAERCADTAAAAAFAAAELPAAHAVRALRAHLTAARGDLDRARALLRTVLDALPENGPVLGQWLAALGPCPWACEADADSADPVAAAVVRLARGDAISALHRVEPLLGDGAPLHPTARLHAWLVAAVAQQACGRARDASEAVERALEIAAPEDYRRPFADGGAAVRRLLQRHATLPTAYAPVVAELIDALERVAAPPPGLVEPLSGRERDVLRLMPTLLPNTEIAGELFVSVNTVKTHVKSIYRKLDVSSRREAVARARQLRLI